MFDKIEKLHHSTIQHGKNNNRVYLMKLDFRDLDIITEKLQEIAATNGYTKIIAKVPEWAYNSFSEKGYKEEASIPQFYKGEDKVHFMSFFCDPERNILLQDTRETINNNITIALSKQNDGKRISLPGSLQIRHLKEEDINNLAGLYKQTFKVYPFPIFDADYIKETMKSHIQYFGVFEKGILCGTSSAEIDHEGMNAEMTDFAVRPDYRGCNIAYLLLSEMEKEMGKQNIKNLYTIARAYSVGMNAAFSRSGYSFAGTLVNNTFISDGIESMNVWYKNMQQI